MITTGKIGDILYITGSGLYDISAVVFSSEISGAFKEVNEALFVTIPQNASWGSVRMESSKRGISGYSNYLFVPQPEIIGFFPSTGIPGTLVTISGYAFSGVTGVQFNNLNSSSVNVSSNFGLTATVPTGNTKGFIKVIGQSGLYNNSASEFFATALITGIAPSSGLTGGYLEISGINFLTDLMYQANSTLDTYYIGFNNNTGEFFRVNSTLLTGMVPENASTGPLTIYRNASDSHYSDFSYTINLANPIITEVLPLSGAAGTDIRIKGYNFFHIQKIYLENQTTEIDYIIDVETDPNTFVSHLGNLIYTKIPTGHGEGKLTIYTYNEFDHYLPYRTSNHLEDAFHILDNPIIIGFDPLKGFMGGELRISGFNLYPQSKVYFNSTDTEPLTNISGDGTNNLLVVSIPSDTFIENVIIIDNMASTVTYSGVFFTGLQPPIITGFSTNSGAWNQPVYVQGSGLSTVTGVEFGNTAMSLTGGFDGILLWERFDDNNIVIYIPEESIDSYINVSNEAGASYSPNPFLVIPPVIVVSGAAPNPVKAGKKITVSGVYMNYATGIIFSGVSGNLYGTDLLNTITGQITVTVPLGTQTNKIRVINRRGSFLSPQNLEILNRPTIFGIDPSTATLFETITISGANFITSDTQFYFLGPNGERVKSDNTNITSSVLATTKIPSGIRSSYIIVSGLEEFVNSSTYFTAIPYISGFTPTETGTREGDYFVLTGINSYEVTGLVMSGSGRNASIIDSSSSLSFNHLAGYSIITGYINAEFQGTGRLALINNGYDFYLNKPLPSNFFSNGIFRTTGAAPTISGVTPLTGSTSTNFTISGNNFLNASTINLSWMDNVNYYTQTKVIVDSKTITGAFFGVAVPNTGFKVEITSPYSQFKTTGTNNIAILKSPVINVVTPSSGVLTGSSLFVSNSSNFQLLETGYLKDYNNLLVPLHITGIVSSLGVGGSSDSLYARIPMDITLTDKDYDLLLINPVGTGTYSSIHVMNKRDLDRQNYIDEQLNAFRTGLTEIFSGVPHPEGSQIGIPTNLYWRTDVPNQISGLYVKNTGTHFWGWVELISF